jgi:hypothetical protein
MELYQLEYIYIYIYTYIYIFVYIYIYIYIYTYRKSSHVLWNCPNLSNPMPYRPLLRLVLYRTLPFDTYRYLLKITTFSYIKLYIHLYIQILFLSIIWAIPCHSDRFSGMHIYIYIYIYMCIYICIYIYVYIYIIETVTLFRYGQGEAVYQYMFIKYMWSFISYYY